MIRVADLKRVSGVVSISALVDIAFASLNEVERAKRARNLRNRIRNGTELRVDEAAAIQQACASIGLVIEHWPQAKNEG